MTESTPIRDAATVIALRQERGVVRVLMGQRGLNVAFMPGKMVFPGGAVDPGDDEISLARGLTPQCRTLLQQQSHRSPEALAAAAIRELWEETGLRLSCEGTWHAPPSDWASFSQGGHLPDAHGLRFVFRAVTPRGRPRRFDARFFLFDAHELAGDIDDFSAAQDELSHLGWYPISEIQEYDLPFITQVALAEVIDCLPALTSPRCIPFFANRDRESTVSFLTADPAPS